MAEAFTRLHLSADQLLRLLPLYSEGALGLNLAGQHQYYYSNYAAPHRTASSYVAK